MGGKILDENDDIIFEFEDGHSPALLLSAFIQKAKFGEKFEENILFSPWINDLLKATLERSPKISGQITSFGAPEYFLKNGMTEMDWGLRDFFHEFTQYISRNISALENCDWKNLSRNDRAKFIRLGLYPNPISDRRLDDMIQDIDMSLESASAVYNPEYKHDR